MNERRVHCQKKFAFYYWNRLSPFVVLVYNSLQTHDAVFSVHTICQFRPDLHKTTTTATTLLVLIAICKRGLQLHRTATGT